MFLVGVGVVGLSLQERLLKTFRLQDVTSSPQNESIAVDPSSKVDTAQLARKNNLVLQDSTQVLQSSVSGRAARRRTSTASKEERNLSQEKTLTDTVKLPKTFYQGRALKYTDLPANRSEIYAREHIYNMYRAFRVNDYIVGEELALYYKNRSNGNGVVNQLIAAFVKNNIVRVIKLDHGLVAQTVKETGINNHFKIPMVMNVSLSLQNNASIKVDRIITSNEPLFKNCVLLPLEMNGVTIIQHNDTVPRKGYVNGDFLFVDYPSSKMAYKLKN